MASSHLILCHPLLFLPSIFPSIRVFSNELVLPIKWPKYWSFSFSTSPFNEYSGLISFKIDWFDLFAVQGILKSLQHHTLKASILQCSAFFMVQLSHPYMTTGKPLLAKWCLCFLIYCLDLSELFYYPQWFWSPRKWNPTLFPIFPHLFAMKWYDMTLSLFFWMLSFTLAFHALLSPSSRGSLVPLSFLPLKWYHLHIWEYWYFSHQSWFQLVRHPV